MSSHQELSSLLTSMEQGGPLVHTVNTAPLFLLLASMDPEPTANLDAELVIESFEACPTLTAAAPEWSPITPPDLMTAKGSGWDGVGGLAMDNGEDYFQDGKVVDVFVDEGCGESNLPASSWVCLPGLAGRDGDPNGQGQETSVVGGGVKWDWVGGCTLPSLKELGLDIYL